MPSKQSTLMITAAGAFFWVFSNVVGLSSFCGIESHSMCREVMFMFLFASIIFLPAFLFAVVIYRMPDNIFYSWQKFTFLWVPVSFVAVLLTSDAPGFFFPSAQEMLGMLMWGLYVLISLVIIIRGYLKPGKK